MLDYHGIRNSIFFIRCWLVFCVECTSHTNSSDDIPTLYYRNTLTHAQEQHDENEICISYPVTYQCHSIIPITFGILMAKNTRLLFILPFRYHSKKGKSPLNIFIAIEFDSKFNRPIEARKHIKYESLCWIRWNNNNVDDFSYFNLVRLLLTFDFHMVRFFHKK